jgi:hypothetical protein
MSANDVPSVMGTVPAADPYARRAPPDDHAVRRPEPPYVPTPAEAAAETAAQRAAHPEIVWSGQAEQEAWVRAAEDLGLADSR